MAKKQKDTPRDGQPRRGRKKFVVLGGLLLLAGFVFFAPAIVARTSLRQQLVPLLLPEFQGHATIGSASLGWFSPIELSDISVTGADGELLLEAASLSSEKSLIGIATHPTKVGKLRIVQPHLHLLLRADGSNLEDAIEPLLKPSDDSPAEIEVAVEITDGKIDVRETESERRWTIHGLEAALTMPAEAAEFTASVAGKVQPETGQPGSFSAEASIGNESTGGLVAVKCDSLPLEVLQPVLRRLAPDVRIGGLLTSDCQLTWTADGASQELDVRHVAGRELWLAAPDWLGGDELRMATLQGRGGMSLRDGRLTLSDVQLDSDLATVSASGTLAASELSVDALLATLQNDDYRVTGEIDLARLAKTLPNTLRIREGTEITSGKVSVTLYSRVESEQRRIVATLETSNLSGEADGHPIRWQQPIQLTMTAARGGESWQIEHLECKSDFLQLTGSGTPTQGELTAEGDLTKLATELGKFVDLSDYKLAGTMHGKLSWLPINADQQSASGTITLDDVELVMPGRRPWREPQLVVQVDAVGYADQRGLQRIDSGGVVVLAGTDSLTGKLKGPIDDPQHFDSIPLDCRVAGNLAAWLPRVQTWLPLDGWNFDGALDAAATVIVAGNSIQFEKATLVVQQLQARSAGVNVIEPEVRVATSGSWSFDERTLSLGSTTLTSSSASVRGENLSVVMHDAGPSLQGNLAYRGDIARLRRWIEDPLNPPTVQLFGMVTGNVALHYDNGSAKASLSAKIADFAVATRSAPPSSDVVRTSATPKLQTIWQEKEIAIAGDGAFAFEPMTIVLDRLEVTAPALRVVAAGRMTDLTGICQTDVRGKLAYDLEGIAQKLRPFLGESLTIAGRDEREFSLTGPLLGTNATADATAARWPASSLAAHASVGWTSANFHSVVLGPGDVRSRLVDGIVQFEPLDITCSGGRLKLSPRVVLNAPSPMLVLDRGPLAEQVQISPDMCESWFKYIAPAVASATRAEGKFSVTLSGAKIPISTPATSDVQGVMQVHSAQIGPGPFGQQMLAIAQQIDAIRRLRPLPGGSPRFVGLAIPPQEIAFHVVDGRVYHQNMVIMAGDIPIRTSGSVGLDQSLDLVAEIPIKDEWVDGNRMLAGLKGTTVKVPIKGTFAKRNFDERAVAAVVKQVVAGSGQKLLEDQIIKGLDGLFRRE